MNHFVPEFDVDDDFVNVSSSASQSTLNHLPSKPITGEEDDLMELLWHNGQVVLHNQRSNKPSSSSSLKLHGGEATPPLPLPPPPPPLDQNLFIQEDEMTSWLHADFSPDLLFSTSSSAPPTSMSQVTASRPPVPPPAQTMSARPPVRNFMNFSRLRGDFSSSPSISRSVVRESAHVSPAATPSSAASEAARKEGIIESRVTAVNNYGSSSAVVGGCGLSRKGKAVATTKTGNEIAEPETDNRKRKERQVVDETEYRSEEAKQVGRGGGSSTSTSTKRSRAAEVHNLSERKRRDRINERMKALQELIPRCNKSDKASMLDEAIDYMKSLQLQVQMMSMGCGMMPMMYPGMQQYMAMGMGINPPPPPTFIPYPNMLATHAQRPLPPQTHLGLPNQHFDPTSVQPQYPGGYIDPYQQFHNLHSTPQFQSQAATSHPSSSRVSSSKEPDDQGNNPTG